MKVANGGSVESTSTLRGCDRSIIKYRASPGIQRVVFEVLAEAKHYVYVFADISLYSDVVASRSPNADTNVLPGTIVFELVALLRKEFLKMYQHLVDETRLSSLAHDLMLIRCNLHNICETQVLVGLGRPRDKRVIP